MSKEFLSHCPEIIYKAEELRARGKYNEAIKLVKPSLSIGYKEIEDGSDHELSDLMRAWRIDVTANTSAAKRSWDGYSAYAHLRAASTVIDVFYDNSFVLERVHSFKKDNEGHPYDFETEMLRDKGRYCVVAAAITGDSSFMIAAEGFFSKALEKASEVTVAGLVRIELGIHTGNFNMIRQGFGQVYEYSLALGNFDRARWAARTYFTESLKRRKVSEGLKALKSLARIRKNPVQLTMDVALGIAASSEFMTAPHNWIRNKTFPHGLNSESLRIN